MITCKALLVSWSMLLSLTAMQERIHLQYLVDQSRQIEAGASEDEVLRLLDEPTERWKERSGVAILLGRRPAQWLYGTSLDLNWIIVPEMPIPNPVPLHLRLFSAHEDDLVIEWNRDKKVTRVTRPALDVPTGMTSLLRPAYFLRDLFELLLRMRSTP